MDETTLVGGWKVPNHQTGALVALSEYNNRDSVRAAMLRKFAASGIAAEIVEQPGKPIAEPLTADETYTLTGWRVPSFRIFYYGIDAQVIEYDRLRFLANVHGKNGRLIKYWSPKNTAPRVYLPPVYDWASIIEDPKKTVGTVEGELKALALTLCGAPYIGLQGVWSHGSWAKGLPILPEFLVFADASRPWEICFDADLRDKVGVRAALFSFMTALMDVGAESIGYVLLPGPEKGADDFLVAKGFPEQKEEALKAFRNLPREQFELLRAAWKIDQSFGILENPPSIIHLESGQLLNQQEAKLIAPTDEVSTTTRAGKKTRVKAFSFWLNDWSLHRKYKSLDYVFGAPRDLAGRVYNKYKPTGCASRKGRVRLWLKLTKNQFPNIQMFRFAVYWLAHLIQHPTVKLPTALVIYGDPGGGKTTWAYIVNRLIFGPSNVEKIGNAELNGNFNTHFVDRLLVVAEEIKGLDPRHDYDHLKDLVTGETIRVKEKYVREHTRKHTAHLIFLSNHRVPVFLTAGDPRYAITHAAKRLSRAEVSEIRRWAENGGCEAVKYYLEQVDLSKFDPFADPPMGKAKEAVIAEARSSLETWSVDLMTDDDRPSLATFNSLKAYAELETGAKAADVSVRHALLDAGAVCLGRVRYPTRNGPRFWVWGLKGQSDMGHESELRDRLKAEEQLRGLFFRRDG